MQGEARSSILAEANMSEVYSYASTNFFCLGFKFKTYLLIYIRLHVYKYYIHLALELIFETNPRKEKYLNKQEKCKKYILYMLISIYILITSHLIRNAPTT